MSRTWDIVSADGHTVVRFEWATGGALDGERVTGDLSIASRPWDRDDDQLAATPDPLVLHSRGLRFRLAALRELDAALTAWLDQPLVRLAKAPFTFRAVLSEDPGARLELEFGPSGPDIVARAEECACRVTIERGRLDAAVRFRMDPTSLALARDGLEERWR